MSDFVFYMFFRGNQNRPHFHIATVFSGYIYKQLKEKKLKRILLIATGALTNATTAQQGESIPGIAHAVSIEI